MQIASEISPLAEDKNSVDASHLETASPSETRKIARLLALSAVALLSFAGVLWFKFGADIYGESLMNALKACF